MQADLILTKGKTFWNNNNKNFKRYPSLNENINCEVVVVGGGITGCLTSYYLTQFNIDTVLIEKNQIGTGSTSASTCLLQYEIDTDLNKLIHLIGEKKAVRAFKLCQKSIDNIENIVLNINQRCDFERKDSLYLCSSTKDIKNMKKEFLCRKKYGFDVNFLEKQEIENMFSFSASCGIISHNCGEIDPLQFSHALLKSSLKNTGRVYENTTAVSFDYYNNSIKVNTGLGYSINCRKLVIASGYSSIDFLNLNDRVHLNTTYSIATNKLDSFKGWKDTCIIWESNRPYSYLRTTSDNRILIGGLDEPYTISSPNDPLLTSKSDALLKKLKEMFPHLPSTYIDYAWSGVFAETKTGLGFIGKHPKLPNTYVNMGFGGNGTTYSVIGAEIIKDLILYDNNPDANIFSF
ncbi:NAD(P)/FAD-dependent oxidoreductase [Clostridium grantii]|uniref:Glycine/D-amino acid oxidase n=1 Tax=Clostridium grantii DSM 8605 TaxID=1121316 RepID=A0A1M5UUY7_9CLOT|nr:FAD-dependent oxidoreductase [Clostridium grantii]SHH66720.1 Glycine/D-amino acid oxidase [Clostridium grantii DSM 8605]